MKIAYLCADVDVSLFGHHGCSIHIRDFTDALGDAGHDVFVVCSTLGEQSELPLPARTYHLVPEGLDAYGLDGKRVIGYLGSFQPWHDLTGLEESVLFTGFVTHESAPEFVGTMDVATVTYRDEGGFHALTEALGALLYQPELAARIGAAARRKALDEHTRDATAKTIMQFTGARGRTRQAHLAVG